MAVRPIDASRFGEILEQWRKDCLEDNDTQGADIISDVILQLDDMPTLTSPNEPLTIEQLREMDGEPVWVETKAGLKFWGIVTKICVSSGDGRYLLITEDTEYGQTWVAYRRPPEGEEDT